MQSSASNLLEHHGELMKVRITGSIGPATDKGGKDHAKAGGSASGDDVVSPSLAGHSLSLRTPYRREAPFSYESRGDSAVAQAQGTWLRRGEAAVRVICDHSALSACRFMDAPTTASANLQSRSPCQLKQGATGRPSGWLDVERYPHQCAFPFSPGLDENLETHLRVE